MVETINMFKIRSHVAIESFLGYKALNLQDLEWSQKLLLVDFAKMTQERLSKQVSLCPVGTV